MASYFAQRIPKVNPDIVVVTFGGNDAQGLRNLDKSWAVQHAPGSGGDDTDWRAEYGKRVGAAMDYLGGDNRTLIWVGIPNDDNPDVTARLQVQNEVVMAEAAKRPKVVFIDTWKRFSGLSGGFAEAVQDPRDGQFKAVRRDDGFHLNTTGAEILALDIAEAIRTELRARGGNLPNASVSTTRAKLAPETLVLVQEAGVVGGAEAELQVAELHEGRRDPSAERAEVFVEQGAGTVGEGLFGELVEALVGHLDGVFGVAVERRRSDRSRRSARRAPSARCRSTGWSRASPVARRTDGLAISRCTRKTISISIAGCRSSTSSTHQLR